MTPEHEASLGPCPLLADEREKVEDHLEQWGFAWGDHWRINRDLAWKISKYVRWLRKETR